MTGEFVRKHIRLISCLVLAAACIAAYVDTLQNPCWGVSVSEHDVFAIGENSTDVGRNDNYDEIYRNSAVKNPSPGGIIDLFVHPRIYSVYSPVRHLSYLMNFAVTRSYSVASFHAGNILLHIAAVIACFYFIVLLSGRTLPAFITAALLAVHPAHSSTVEWISARGPIMVGLFSLLTMIGYIAFASLKDERGPKKYLFYSLSLLSYGLGFLSYPTILFMPIVIASYELGVRNTGGKVKNRLRETGGMLAPFILLAGVCYAVIGHVLPHPHSVLTVWRYYGVDALYRILGTAYEYLYHILFLFERYGSLGSIVLLPELSDVTFYLSRLAAIVFLLLMYYYAYRVRRERWIIVAAFFSFATMLPGLLAVYPSEQMSKRNLYVPSIGIYALVALFIERISADFAHASAWPRLRDSVRQGTRDIAVFLVGMLVLFAPHLYRGEVYSHVRGIGDNIRSGDYEKAAAQCRTALASLDRSTDPSRKALSVRLSVALNACIDEKMKRSANGSKDEHRSGRELTRDIDDER